MEIDQYDEQVANKDTSKKDDTLDKNTNSEIPLTNIPENKRFYAVIHGDYLDGSYPKKTSTVSAKLRKRKDFITAVEMRSKKCIRVASTYMSGEYPSQFSLSESLVMNHLKATVSFDT